jgi:hypothetical protein
MKLFLGLALILFLTGCDAEKGDHTMQIKIDTGMKAHCIGHSLIDLPDGYSLKSGVSGLFTPDQNVVEDGDIDLQVRPAASAAEFQRQTGVRHGELANDAGLTSKLSEVRDLPDGGKLFRVHIIDDAYQSEVHWLLRDRHLIASVKSFKNQVAPAEAMLLEFLHRVTVQTEADDLRAAFCLGGVIVKGNYRAESSSFNFTSPATAEIAFSVDIDTYEKDDAQSLYQRMGGPNALLKKFDVKESVLRKSENSIAGMRAQEWASAIRPGEQGSVQDLLFILETMRSKPSPAAPKIHLEMHVTGRSAQDETDALALWDRVTRSIRPR